MPSHFHPWSRLPLTHLGVAVACGVVSFTSRAAPAAPADANDWPHVFHDKGGTRYSPLDQINRDNVAKLQIAWTYHTGDAGPGNTTIECTPIVIGGVMYVTTVRTRVVALDAATGREIWKFDPHADGVRRPRPASGGVNRGVAWWSDGKPTDQGGQRRILVGLADGRLISLDAGTGKPDPAFGNAGTVDLRADLREDCPDIDHYALGPTSAPAVCGDVVVVGVSNDESLPSAPGDTRGFDVRTGKQVWRFHAIPRQGEFGADQWPKDAWKNRGGANAWGGLTFDEQAGVVYAGTGSACADFFGGDRPGNDLFANCVLALDARTGKRLWHFQTVHHDLWDLDNPCPPVLVTVKHDGRTIEAAAEVTKTGYCYLLDRKTGQPLFEVREEPAPPSDVPGEQASPTQPVPVKPPPFARQRFTDADASDISPETHAYVLKQLAQYRHGDAHEPPSERGTVATPGFRGGATWSCASFDPTTGLLYVNSNDAPTLLKLRRRDKAGAADQSATRPAERNAASPSDWAVIGYHFFEDEQGHPAIKPPWGSLTAIDLNTGTFAWRITLGEYPDLAARGVQPTGSENFGGTIVTSGGLVFIGGTKDEKFHAFDKSTGKLLWEHKLNAGGYATPCTYSVKGRQFVCIAAGGGGKPNTKPGDEFVAFALPEQGAGKADGGR